MMGPQNAYFITDFDYEFSDEYMKSPVDVKKLGTRKHLL